MLHSVDDLFQSRLMEYLEEWNHWLAPIVPDILDLDIVIHELKQQLKRIREKTS